MTHRAFQQMEKSLLSVTVLEMKMKGAYFHTKARGGKTNQHWLLLPIPFFYPLFQRTIAINSYPLSCTKYI